ncbi:hypothetical protein WR25_26969 [Diploscapter pachys]|uniref:Uncharacterized protein n=1 Tax=Diploscapter pachys TaxID=2018661 RepID=A0A2A2JMN3_9BILA|nr:hypothetical protein WR25_26969 [Diploscapter pachys]
MMCSHSSIDKNEHFQAIPSQNIASCLPRDKLASLMNNLFCCIGRPNSLSLRNQLFNEKMIGKSVKCEPYVSYHVEDYTNSNIIVFVQDPLMRFLDAYIEKCTMAGQNQTSPRKSSSCFGCKDSLKCTLERLYAKLRMIAQSDIRYYEEAPQDNEDVLIYPLSCYCNFKKSSLRKMTVIRLEEESESLASAELAEFFNSRRVSQNSMVGVFRSVDDMLSQLTQTHSKTKKVLKEEMQKDPYLLSLFSKIFHHDYQLFGFTLQIKPLEEYS